MSVFNFVPPPQLVVLGRGMLPNGEPSDATRNNAEAVARCYRKYPESITKIVLSGGHSPLSATYGREDMTEAVAMEQIALQAGVPEDIVQIEDTSTSTLGNLINTGRLLDPREVAGVFTQSEHLTRAMYLAELVMPVSVRAVPSEKFGSPKGKSGVLEASLLYKEHLLLMGIKPGDLSRFQRREQLAERAKAMLATPIRKVLSKPQYA